MADSKAVTAAAATDPAATATAATAATASASGSTATPAAAVGAAAPPPPKRKTPLVIPENISLQGKPLTLLYTLLKNVLDEPEVPGFRRFKADKVVPRLLLTGMGQFRLVKLVHSAGFVENSASGEFVLPADAPLAPLQRIVDSLPTLLNPYTNPPVAIPVAMDAATIARLDAEQRAKTIAYADQQPPSAKSGSHLFPVLKRPPDTYPSGSGAAAVAGGKFHADGTDDDATAPVSAAARTAAHVVGEGVGLPPMAVNDRTKQLLGRYAALMTTAAPVADAGGSAPGGPALWQDASDVKGFGTATAAAAAPATDVNDQKGSGAASASAAAPAAAVGVPLSAVEPWATTLDTTIAYFARRPGGNLLRGMLNARETAALPTAQDKAGVAAYAYSPLLNSKVSLWSGDITTLAVDAVVNAAHRGLTGGGGVDGAIHRAAGEAALSAECAKHPNGCEPGEAVLTSGCALPAKHIAHTVGPTKLTANAPTVLRLCYQSVLALVKAKALRSVAFVCISAGNYEFPITAATHIALQEVRFWLEANHSANALLVDRIVFVVHTVRDEVTYHELMPLYFPADPKHAPKPAPAKPAASTATTSATTATGAP